MVGSIVPSLASAETVVVPFELALTGIGRVVRLAGHRWRRERAALGRHWYLWLLGVAPESRGRGIAGSLPRPVLEQANRDGLPCCLQTFSVANVHLYQNPGLTVAQTRQMAHGGPEVRWMVRLPRSG